MKYKLLLIAYCSLLIANCLTFVSCDNLPEESEETGGESYISDDFGASIYSQRERETALGDMVCDAAVYKLNIDTPQHRAVHFAIVNGGLFESGRSRGPVTPDDIDGLLKGDTLWIVTLNGQETIRLFTEDIAAVPLGDNRWPQFSREVRCVINKTGNTVSVTINGGAIDPQASYNIAVCNILASGAHGGKHGYPVLNNVSKQDIIETGIMVSEAVRVFIESQPQPYTPATDGRQTVIN